MRNDEILAQLKQERDYRAFCNGAESFVKRWAPQDRREVAEFTADLMGLFREMIITQQAVHQEVAAHYFKQSMDMATIQPRPVFVGVDPASGPDVTSITICEPDGTVRPATQEEIVRFNKQRAWEQMKERVKNEG